jgi:hypothetical protein
MKQLFLIQRNVDDASGTQTFYVDADNEEDAITRHNKERVIFIPASVK